MASVLRCMTQRVVIMLTGKESVVYDTRNLFKMPVYGLSCEKCGHSLSFLTDVSFWQLATESHNATV